MSAAPVDLAELACQRLDGDLADEAWRALEQEHGEALARALAREAATREAMRALPREPAPTRVREAILANAAAHPIAAAPARRPGAGARWWMGAAILAAACLVTGIALRFDRAPGRSEAGGEAGAVARREPATAERQIAGAPAAAAEARQANAQATDEVTVAKVTRSGGGRRLADAAKAKAADGEAGEADDRRLDEAAVKQEQAQGGVASSFAPPSEAAPVASNEELARLRDDATTWRLNHPAAPGAAPVPEQVLREAASKPGDEKERLLAQVEKDEADKDDARAPGGAKDAKAAPIVADRGLELKKADAPVDTAAQRKLQAGAAPTPPTDVPAAADIGPVAAAPPPARSASIQPGAKPAAPASAMPANPARATLALDDAVVAHHALAGRVVAAGNLGVFTLENRGAEPLVVPKGAIALEGMSATPGVVMWRLPSGQPEADETVAPGASRAWRVSFADLLSRSGVVALRASCRGAVSNEVPTPNAPAQGAGGVDAAPAGTAAPPAAPPHP